jgi:hypothetical protein
MFDLSEWDRLLAAVAAKAAHTAALLDGELPPEVVADAAAVDVDLLPGAGELSPRCSCPDWADPCKHAAAVVYLVADVLDADPFALLLVRGRSREEVLADLRRRRRAVASGRRSGGGDLPGGVLRARDPGIEARRAWGLGEDAAGGERRGWGSAAAVAVSAGGAGSRQLPGGRLPPVPLPPRHPGAPAALPADPPAASGLRAGDLAQLAADAARRAWALCTGDGDGGLTLDPELDLIRRAAGLLAAPGRGSFDELSARAGYRPGELLELARAWRYGGADAVSVVADAWPATGEALAEGRTALASVVGRPRAWRNRLTVAGAGVQLRLSRDGEWYLLVRAGDGWDLVAGPEHDPAKLVGAWAAQSGRSMA